MITPEARPEITQDTYDAVFYFPGYTFPQKEVKGFRQNLEGRYERNAGTPRTTHPSGLLADSRIKLDLAAILARKGRAKKIITMSRKTRSWMETSNAVLGENHIKRLVDFKKREIGFDKEEYSWDTRSELEEVRRMSAEKGLKNVAIVVTSDKTRDRALNLINQLSTPDSPFPNINLLTINDVAFDPTLNIPERLKQAVINFNNSPFMQRWENRENSIGRLERISPLVSTLISQTARLSR